MLSFTETWRMQSLLMLQRTTVFYKFDSRRKLANLVRHGKSVADLGSGLGHGRTREKHGLRGHGSIECTRLQRLREWNSFLKPAIVQPNPACPTNRNRCGESIWNRWSN